VESNTVTIVALGATKAQCPYNGEIWTLNQGFYKALRFDKLFLVHSPKECGILYKDLAEFGGEIVSMYSIPKIRTTTYPFKQICKRFHTSYFPDTLAYMIAYALYYNYKEIKLYGADMSPPEDYIWERPGVEYWIGIAEGMGVKVWRPPGSSICRTLTGRPYGTEGDKRIRIWKEVNEGTTQNVS